MKVSYLDGPSLSSSQNKFFTIPKIKNCEYCYNKEHEMFPFAFDEKDAIQYHSPELSGSRIISESSQEIPSYIESEQKLMLIVGLYV